MRCEPRESEVALKPCPPPSGHWDVTLLSLLLWAHGSCPHMFLLERALGPVPSGSPGRCGTSSHPSFWGAPEAPSGPGSASTHKNRGGGGDGWILVGGGERAPGRVVEPASAVWASGQCSVGWPLAPATVGSFGDVWVGRDGRVPALCPAHIINDKNHRLLKVTCLKFSNLDKDKHLPSLRIGGGGSSSITQDLTEIQVSFGFFPWLPEPPGQDSELFP